MKAASILRPSNLSLIRELVSSDFKLRYQGSFLGYLWSLLRPLMLFGVLFIVFTKIVRIGDAVPNYPSYLLLGLIMWTFFVEATMSGLNAITGRADLVKKVNIPKYVIVVSTTLSALINLSLNLVVLAVFMFFGKVHLQPVAIFLPIFIAELIIFSLALAFLLSAIYVKFRDVSHIWEVVLQVLFYATPFLYPFTLPSPAIAKILSINPLAQIVQDARAVLITPETLTTKEVYGSQIGRLIPVLIVVVISYTAVRYFKHKSSSFAEEL